MGDGEYLVVSSGELAVAEVEGDGLGAVEGLVNAHQSVAQLERVVPQRDDDELSVLCATLAVVVVVVMMVVAVVAVAVVSLTDFTYPST